MRYAIGVLLALFALNWIPREASAQVTVEGDFRLRWYSDRFSEAMDNRGDENYLRYLGRLRARAPINTKAHFYTELITWTQNNPTSPVRNIAGTGVTQYGISQIFAELVQPDLLVFDLVRVRVGRQQFPIGKGLSQGESYYFFDKFDGARLDLAYGDNTLSLFGAITGQNVSESGLYPDPGSDQIYIARLARPVMGENLMAYYIYNKLRGDFNDSYIYGFGINGQHMKNRLEYAFEIAQQEFNNLGGLPDKGGVGYMGNISYRFPLGALRSVKVETRYAAYQGDDADTPDQQEMFSPLYPSWFWGGRRGYANGAIGGDYPWNDRNPEGTRVWYTRFYFIPRALPALRVQFQYLDIGEWVDNDNYNSMDDEYAISCYYRLAPQVQMQLRFVQSLPNDDDRDANDSGGLSWSEDRVKITRFMTELSVNF